jgi:hypothetical protein
MKLTATPWLAFSAMAAAGLLLPALFDPLRHKMLLCRSVPAISLGLLILGLYALRGMLISGYAFYPVKALGFPTLLWAVPVTTLSKDTSGIRDWPTRGTGESGVFEFAWTWIENQFGLTNILFGLGVLTLGLGVAVVAARKVGLQQLIGCLRPYWPVLAAAACGFVVCFAFAPALRFVSGYFFVLVGLCMGTLPGILQLGAKARPGILLCVVAATMIPNAGGTFSRGVALAGFPPLPLPEVTEMSTAQGEIIRVNANGFSWAAEPPATPYFDPALLVLRDNKGTIRAFTGHPRPNGTCPAFRPGKHACKRTRTNQPLDP